MPSRTATGRFTVLRCRSFIRLTIGARIAWKPAVEKSSSLSHSSFSSRSFSRSFSSAMTSASGRVVVAGS
jgi:hypothetical protein